ncbi:MAG: DNA-processing protein DprA [Kiritimatiellae bacterium]|nr:DNA-processing protein DprA [Kiritimatiellia bacterium]
MTEREAYIALNMMDNVGPVGVRALVEVLGTAAAIFEAPRRALVQAPGVGPELAEKITVQRETCDPVEEEKRAATMGARIVTRVDDEYPERLAQIHDPPLALYVVGGFNLQDKHGLAVVGTRHPTNYGRAVTERLSRQISQAGYTLVSGLARGIDTVAHNGALKAQGRTIAVLGSAVDRLYPPENAPLAREAAANGAVVSEFRLGTEPGKTTFPMRNRIISGLSMGVVVVEAGLKSGAMITARSASEQGRSVFAVPGRIDSQASKGTHDLIRNGAGLVEDIDDILREFEFLLPAGNSRRAGSAAPDPRPAGRLSETETRVVDYLRENGEVDVDSLTRALEMKAAAASPLLLGLEMKRVVRMLPGRLVQLVQG